MSFAYYEKIHYGDALPPPADYDQGDLFIDLNDALVYIHDGTDWVVVGTDPTVTNFDTYDDLRASPTPGSPIILIGGRSVPGDGGQGFFVRDPLNRADNDGTVLVDADGQSWQRIFTGDVLAVWFFGNGASISLSDFDHLYGVVRTYHNTNTIDWIGVELNIPSTSSLAMPGYWVVKRLTARIAYGVNAEFYAQHDIGPTYVEFDSCQFYGESVASGSFTFRTDDDTALIVHDSYFNVINSIILRGKAVVADSYGRTVGFVTYDNSVLRNSVVENIDGGAVHRLRGNSFVFGNVFFAYNSISTVNVYESARVVNNSIISFVLSGPWSGTTSIIGADGAIFANNYVYLQRQTYPYVLTLSNVRKATIVGNYVESHTLGGQDSTQWTFSSDGEAIVIANNVWAVRGGSGNYGVRIRGTNGAKANAIVANNLFMNFGSRAGSGVQRRNGIGNLRFVGNVFYNWYYGMHKYDSATTAGSVEGNSNAFSNVVTGINDPDYVNGTADTNWS